jgi:hypothetical protein
MRVVVDARTGAIRDANRIVPGPGLYGPGGYAPGAYGPSAYGPNAYGPRGYGPDVSRSLGMAPPPDEAPGDDMPPPNGAPPRFGTSPTEQDMLGAPPQQQSARFPMRPPLPRPRPATLVAEKPAHDVPAAATESVPDAKPGDSKPDVAATVPMTTPKSALPSAKPGKASALPAIND